jgi:GNAT superfamily N-acetyltransferase
LLGLNDTPQPQSVRIRKPSDGFVFQVLNIFTARAFSALTAAVYRPILADQPGLPFTAIGASLNGKAVGLALAKDTDQSAYILSIYVRPEYRRQRVGVRLLELLEDHLRERRDFAELTYALGADASPFEQFLHTCDWPLEGPRLHFFCADAGIVAAPWFDRAILPNVYTIADWSTITLQEREDLAASQEPEQWIPEHLLPFAFESRLEQLNSLILRHSGAVIGWLLGESNGDGHIRYVNLYVRPSLNRVGHTFCTLALIAEATRRQVGAHGPRSRGFFEVQPGNTDFLRFIDRHLANHLVSRTELKKLTKQLR